VGQELVLLRLQLYLNEVEVKLAENYEVVLTVVLDLRDVLRVVINQFTQTYDHRF
jgi:hypothetical protein